MDSDVHVVREPYVDPADVRARKWIASNLESFDAFLLQFTKNSRTKATTEANNFGLTVPDRMFDPALRLPEEMPICKLWDSWSRENPVPPGFKIARGSVFIEDPDFLDNPSQYKRIDHQYLEAIDGSGIVIDHAFAQFYKRRAETLRKGERRDVISKKAGDLVSSFLGDSGEQRTFLIGRKDDIAARVKLRYDPLPRSEGK